MKDLIILGNGMAGMTAALYASRANLNFKIVGRDEYDFGQIGNAILVENFPCLVSQSGFELASGLHDQLSKNEIPIEEHEVVAVELIPFNNLFIISYADGTQDMAKSVIYALGASHRKLNCPIDKEVPIHYCALCDGNFYKDKSVAIIGGGDVAFTQAEYLSKICSKVEIVMCDKNVTAAPTTFERVSNIDNVFITYDYPVDKIVHYATGKNGLYSKEKCSDEYSNSCIQVDGIFIAIGMEPNTAPIKIPFALDSLNYIIANENGETGINGFFAAGDVRYKRVRQGITAAADGACAVQSVINYLKNYKG